jgi:hypothetical protein
VGSQGQTQRRRCALRLARVSENGECPEKYKNKNKNKIRRQGKKNAALRLARVSENGGVQCDCA